MHRIGLGIVAVLIVFLFIGREIMIDKAGNTWPIRPLQQSFRELPKKLGDWTAIEAGEIAPDIFEALAADDAEERTYENSDNIKVGYHTALFQRFNRSLPHTPFVCYPNSGWDIIDRQKITITLPDGTTFKPMFFSAESKKQGKKAIVIFWFQFGDLVLTLDEELRLAYEHYREDGQWPSTVKVLMHMPAGQAGDSRALEDLAARIYEHTRKLHDGKIPESNEPVPNED